MSNNDRVKGRIERDIARKADNKANKNKQYNDLGKIFTINNHRKAVKLCKKGVMWKTAAQTYCKYAVKNALRVVRTYRNGDIIPLANSKKEIIRERGKEREITPIVFSDRVPQRIICDNSLVPLTLQTIIKDNCASLPNKGVDYARKRIDYFLGQAIKKWGDNFYVLVTDFKSFFDSIPHITCYNVLNRIYDNDAVVDLLMKIIKSYHEKEIIGDKSIPEEERKNRLIELNNLQLHGVCLGSQVSQIVALLVPNKLDHFIKDENKVKFYLRYMDDSVIFHNDKEYLKELYHGMKSTAESLGLRFNEKKTRIVKISNGFKFLKIHYSVDGRKIIRTLDRTTITRQRNKLKKFRKMVDNGKMSLDDVYNSMQSWLAHCKYASHSYHSKKSMLKIYNELFDGYKITKQYEKYNKPKQNGGRETNELLQSYKWNDIYWDCNYNRPS